MLDLQKNQHNIAGVAMLHDILQKPAHRNKNIYIFFGPEHYHDGCMVCSITLLYTFRMGIYMF